MHVFKKIFIFKDSIHYWYLEYFPLFIKKITVKKIYFFNIDMFINFMDILCQKKK